MQKLRGAALRFRIMAWVTGVVLATAFVWLVLGRLFWDYGNPEARPALYGYLWIAHGWLYFIYLIVGVDLADPRFWDGGLAIIDRQLAAAEQAARDAGRI